MIHPPSRLTAHAQTQLSRKMEVMHKHCVSQVTFPVPPPPHTSHTLISASGRSNTLAKGVFMFEFTVIGAKAKNILILRSSSGMDEKAMKPVWGRRKQTLPCYF